MSELTADKIITDDQLELLLNSTKERMLKSMELNHSFYYINDYYLIAIAANTGLRIAEVADLKWSDIHRDFLVVQCGKGSKKRSVDFGAKTRHLFDELKQRQNSLPKRSSMSRHIARTDQIFVGIRGPLTPNGIHRRFDFWRKAAKIPPSISFHSLRHYYPTKCLELGMSLAYIKKQMGHSNISITSIYLHFTAAEREKIKNYF